MNAMSCAKIMTTFLILHYPSFKVFGQLNSDESCNHGDFFASTLYHPHLRLHEVLVYRSIIKPLARHVSNPRKSVK